MLTNLQIASRILEGELSLRRGNPDAAIAVLGEAVTIEDGIPYNEPPVWHHPPRQILGAVLLEAGRPAEAEAVYREDLEALPRERVVALRSREEPEAQQKSSEALEVKRRFETAWKRADIRLTSSRVMEAGTGPAEQPSAFGASRDSTLHAARHVNLADGTRLAYVEQGDTEWSARDPAARLHRLLAVVRAGPPASATVASRACGDAARTWRFGQAGW